MMTQIKVIGQKTLSNISVADRRRTLPSRFPSKFSAAYVTTQLLDANQKPTNHTTKRASARFPMTGLLKGYDGNILQYFYLNVNQKIGENIL
jgi:hypothetical protein